MDSQDKLAVKKALYDICLSIFRGQPMKYTGKKAILCGKKISMTKVILFFFWALLVLPPFLGLVLMLVGFVFMEKWIYDEVYYQNPGAFTLVEELKVLDFEKDMPAQLSFQEIQIIKKIKLSFKIADHDRFLGCLKEAKNSPNLKQWVFIKWLETMTPEHGLIITVFARD